MAVQSFQRILELLEQHGVAYIIVGGVAAVLRGAPVTTFDIDALVRIDPANIDRLANALESLDARYRERQDLRPTRADLMSGGHFLLMTDSGPLDVLGVLAGGRRFDDMIESCSEMPLGNLKVKVLSLEALVDEKRALGRPKDRAMLELLEAVLARRNTGG
jgi:predicted nucleotidyltransferase